jgi:hypothetical protein
MINTPREMPASIAVGQEHGRSHFPPKCCRTDEMNALHPVNDRKTSTTGQGWPLPRPSPMCQKQPLLHGPDKLLLGL